MAAETSPSDNAQNRDRSIRLAVLTSLLSKFGTILLRLVSIPIALRLLGVEEFGVYAVITMTAGIIDVLHIGIGPALTREISVAIAKGDHERERVIFSTCVLLSTAFTILCATLVSALLLTIPIPDLFGEEFAPLSETMLRAAWIGVAIIVVEAVCIVFEMARDGYMETRYTNAWGAGGNVLGAGLVLGGIWFFPTIEFLLLAVNGSMVLAKLGNTVHFLFQRSYLFPKFSSFRFGLVPGLLRDGLRFSITYVGAAFLEYNVMAFLIGRIIGPDAVAVFNVMVTIHFSMAGLVAMFTKPVWPALMDAFERNDRTWIMRMAKRLRLGTLGFSVIVTVGLVSIGPYLLPWWGGENFANVREGFRTTRPELLAFSAYFLLHVWRQANQTLALGVGKTNSVVCVVIGEGLFLIGLAVAVLVQSGELTLVYLTMAGSLLLFSGWMFPLIFREGLKQPLDSPSDEGIGGIRVTTADPSLAGWRRTGAAPINELTEEREETPSEAGLRIPSPEHPPGARNEVAKRAT